MMDELSKQEELTATSNVYSLLGRLWLQEIDESMLAEFQSEPLRSTFQFSDSIGADDLDSLAAEYCQLFVGPKNHFPPMQSVWQEGTLDSEITTSVKSFADSVSYQPSSEYPSTFFDHLGIELEIMARIMEIIANQALDDPQADETLTFAQEFFGRHLSWPEKLIAAAESHAHSDFYRTLLVNTRDFLEIEVSRWR